MAGEGHVVFKGIRSGSAIAHIYPSSFFAGFNVCIFAYGQTGSGKTHTMSGTHTERAEGRGINYRALEDLFGIRDARADEVRGRPDAIGLRWCSTPGCCSQ